jgi:hypothetical protein
MGGLSAMKLLATAHKSGDFHYNKSNPSINPNYSLPAFISDVFNSSYHCQYASSHKPAQQ